ncbi:hypothetical protein KC19_2G272200 [Ceratodon purpureus]|uniref:Uncharacterized protein n=1 Tax=Ceratodon purpureus TaxID=3225 RepID=A0A8T0IZQ0_CERPU|nr:hypothetical protein KC19_2G272200 [Ceratodon purpureus]
MNSTMKRPHSGAKPQFPIPPARPAQCPLRLHPKSPNPQKRPNPKPSACNLSTKSYETHQTLFRNLLTQPITSTSVNPTRPNCSPTALHSTQLHPNCPNPCCPPPPHLGTCSQSPELIFLPNHRQPAFDPNSSSPRMCNQHPFTSHHIT